MTVEGRSDEALRIEVDAQGEDAIGAFLDWAGRHRARHLYVPDVLLGVDDHDRRGWLLDEVYWITIWADRGVDAIRSALTTALAEDAWRVVPDSASDPHELLSLVMRRGRPCDEVQT